MLLFSHYVLSDSLWPHGLQHTRLTCPSLSPGVCSNSCPLSQWCYINISLSATHFFFCLQSFPGRFRMSQFFTSGGRSIVASPSASATILPMNSRVEKTLKSLLQHHNLKASILWHSAFFMIQLSYPYMTTCFLFPYSKGKHLNFRGLYNYGLNQGTVMLLC